MTIRTRLTLWFTSVLFASLVAMGVLSYYELVAEPRSEARPGDGAPTQKDADEGAGDVVAILAW